MQLGPSNNIGTRSTSGITTPDQAFKEALSSKLNAVKDKSGDEDMNTKERDHGRGGNEEGEEKPEKKKQKLTRRREQ